MDNIHVVLIAKEEGGEACWRSRRAEGNSLSSMLEKCRINHRSTFRNRFTPEETAAILSSFGEQKQGRKGRVVRANPSPHTNLVTSHVNVVPGS